MNLSFSVCVLACVRMCVCLCVRVCVCVCVCVSTGWNCNLRTLLQPPNLELGM